MSQRLQVEGQWDAEGDAEGPPAAFFSAAAEQFEVASRTVGGAIDRFYRIAGFDVRVRLAGPAFVPLVTPALAHLERSPIASPALTVCLWDSAATGTRMPSAPWASTTLTYRCEVPGYNTERFRTVVDVATGALSMLDAAADVGLFWSRDASRMPSYEAGSPLRSILHWWLAPRGRQVVHAAAVGTAHGGVLLAGASGSGKSTSALSCLGSPLQFAADDYCAFAVEPEPRAYSLYSAAKADARTMAWLSHLDDLVGNATEDLNEEKAVLLLWERYRHQIAREFPLVAVLLPRVVGGTDTRVSPASPLEGIRALVPSTVIQLAGAERTAWKAMMDLVKRVPCYHLRLGSNLRRVPDVIADVIHQEG